MVAKVTERLAVNKQAAQKFDVEWFNLRKLTELEVRKEYQIKISNMFAALENLNDNDDINRAWQNIEENIKTSAKESLDLNELKRHKPWFDEERLRFLDQRKQDKMQWLQEQNQSDIDNLNNAMRETSKHFRNKKRYLYLKANIYQLETNSTIKKTSAPVTGHQWLYEGLPAYNLYSKNKKGDLVTESHSILARWRKHFSQLFSVHVIIHVRQTEIHTAEQLVPKLSAFEVEMAIERHISPSTDQIPAEMIKAGGRKTRWEIHKLINSVRSKEELPKKWRARSLYLSIYYKGDKNRLL